VKKKWPFPGEVPTVRSRKVALAYREGMRQQHEYVRALAALLEQADTRLMSYNDPATVAAITELIKTIGDEDPVEALDQRFSDWGERWHCEQLDHYEPDDYVKAKVAANLIHVAAKTISGMRIDGKIKGVWDPEIGTNGGYWYRVGDLYDMRARMPLKPQWRPEESTVTLNDSRRGDGKCAAK
jgi:hypothetical protein